MNLSRRKFLAIGLAVSAAPLYALYAWRWGDPTDIIVAILKRRVGYLRVEHGTFHDFAKSYISFRKDYEHQLATLSFISVPLQFLSPYSWLTQGNSFRRLEDNVVSRYLLSTDFFANNANEQRAVSYISFYDPYTRPCGNPFNRQP
jgi:hypothetical protein